MREWTERERIAWESESGVTHRGTWTVREAHAGTELGYCIEYSLPGPFGWLAELLTGRIVDRNVRASLLAARRILEHERPARPSAKAAKSPTGAKRAASTKR